MAWILSSEDPEEIWLKAAEGLPDDFKTVLGKSMVIVDGPTEDPKRSAVDHRTLALKVSKGKWAIFIMTEDL
jgi:hypothetical protein